jgi:DNA polymerase III delta subunit
MSSCAWEKFHLAAEILRQDGDKRSKLAEAFAHEIGQLKEVDIPQNNREIIGSIFDQLSLPDNVETLSRMARPHLAVKHLTDDQINAIIEAIFKIEGALNIHSAQN